MKSSKSVRSNSVRSDSVRSNSVRSDSVGACNHPRLARREALQIGSIGLLGMGLNHLTGLRQAVAADNGPLPGKAKSCIFNFSVGWFIAA